MKAIKESHQLLPIFIDISPMAQVALLHTEINSGFKFEPRIGIKSPAASELES